MTIQGNQLYKMTAGSFARELFLRYGRPWLVVILLLIILGVLAFIIMDFRWGLLFLFIVLVLMPAVMAFLYYGYALRRECFINTLPHTIAVVDDRLVVSLYALIPDDDLEILSGETNVLELPRDDVEEAVKGSQKEHYRKLHDEIFNSSVITHCERSIDGVEISIKDKHKGFIWVPSMAFGDPQDFTKFTNWLFGT